MATWGVLTQNCTSTFMFVYTMKNLLVVYEFCQVKLKLCHIFRQNYTCPYYKFTSPAKLNQVPLLRECSRFVLPTTVYLKVLSLPSEFHFYCSVTAETVFIKHCFFQSFLQDWHHCENNLILEENSYWNISFQLY